MFYVLLNVCINFELRELCYDQDRDRVVRFYAGSVELMRVSKRDQIFVLVQQKHFRYIDDNGEAVKSRIT